MGQLLQIILTSAGVVALLLAISAFWRARYRLALGAEATHYTTTEDGWRLAIHRYGSGSGEPVLLCHGLGANAFNHDLGPKLSLARHLAARGLDVWSLELRGHGASAEGAPPGWSHRRWSFDQHALEDVPAAIDRVLAVSGASRLHWVGHSMGGLAIYAYLSQTQDARVASLCAIASPTHFERNDLVRRMHGFWWFLSYLPTFPVAAFSGLVIPLYWGLRLPYPTHNPASVSVRAIRAALANLVCAINPWVLRQFAVWFETGEFLSADRTIDYGDALATVTTPACAIVGSADRLARPSEAREGHQRLASAVREFHHLGRDSGANADYGHGDLLIGDHAPRDVFPVVTQWLEARRAAPRPARRRHLTSAVDLAPSRLFDPYTRRLRHRFMARQTPRTSE